MHKKFRVEGKQPIYDPDDFEAFCKESGCADLYTTLLASQTTSRQSDERFELARIRTVAIMYRLVYGLSQWANFYQRDYGTYLSYSGATQNALETARNVEDSTSSQLIGKKIETIIKKHQELLEKFFADAVEKKCLTAVMIDDYTRARHFKRPENETATSVSYNMCTMVCKKFPEIPAIPRTKDAHNADGLDVQKVVSYLLSDSNVKQVTSTTFASYICQTGWNPIFRSRK